MIDSLHRGPPKDWSPVVTQEMIEAGEQVLLGELGGAVSSHWSARDLAMKVYAAMAFEHPTEDQLCSYQWQLDQAISLVSKTWIATPGTPGHELAKAIARISSDAHRALSLERSFWC